MTARLIVLVSLLAFSQARFIERPHDVFRILGGVDAEPGEFPHLVSLQWGFPSIIEFDHLCGGSIINEEWILTAAHCVEGLEFLADIGGSIVKAGKYDLNITETSEQVRFAKQFFVHEKYNGSMEASPYDIGLIKLGRSLKFNKHVAPISLPKKDTEPEGAVILPGWGAINDDTDYPEDSHVLQKVDLKIIDRITCNKAVEKINEEDGEIISETDLVDEASICTGPLTGGLSPCNGDSGGALIKKGEDGKPELVGIVSWSLLPCGRKGAPTVSVKVSSFIDWIENIISKN